MLAAVLWEKTDHYKGGENHPNGDVLRFVFRKQLTMNLPNRGEFWWYPFEKLTYFANIELEKFNVGG